MNLHPGPDVATVPESAFWPASCQSPKKGSGDRHPWSPTSRKAISGSRSPQGAVEADERVEVPFPPPRNVTTTGNGRQLLPHGVARSPASTQPPGNVWRAEPGLPTWNFLATASGICLRGASGLRRTQAFPEAGQGKGAATAAGVSAHSARNSTLGAQWRRSPSPYYHPNRDGGGEGFFGHSPPFGPPLRAPETPRRAITYVMKPRALWPCDRKSSSDPAVHRLPPRHRLVLRRPNGLEGEPYARVADLFPCAVVTASTHIVIITKVPHRRKGSFLREASVKGRRGSCGSFVPVSEGIELVEWHMPDARTQKKKKKKKDPPVPEAPNPAQSYKAWRIHPVFP